MLTTQTFNSNIAIMTTFCYFTKCILNRAVEDVGLISRALHTRVVDGTRSRRRSIKSISNCGIVPIHTRGEVRARSGLPVVELTSLSCLHMTVASLTPQPRSHIVPHCQERQTSTLPSFSPFPPANLTSPSVTHSSPRASISACFHMH